MAGGFGLSRGSAVRLPGVRPGVISSGCLFFGFSAFVAVWRLVFDFQ